MGCRVAAGHDTRDRTDDPQHYLRTQFLVALAALAAVWVWVAAMPLAYLDPEYPIWRAKLTMLRQCDLGDVLILGDSRAAVDVMPTLLPIRATNLAVGGGEPIEAEVLLQRALACPVPPRRVVISFDAAHFTTADLFWERSVKYGLVKPRDLATLRRISHDTGDATFAVGKLPDGLAATWRARLYAWRFPPLYFASLVKGGVFLRWWRNHKAFTDAITTRGQYFFGRDAGSSTVAAEGHMAAFQPLPVLDRYFDRILKLLAARGIPADFVAMPMNNSTGRAVRPEARIGFARYLAAYAARYPGFHVVGTVMPEWPDRYFGDGFSHLNPDGAQILSLMFGKCLLNRLNDFHLASSCLSTLLD